MYTVKTLTHIVEGNKLQALISFEYKSKIEFTIAIMLLQDVVTDLETMYTDSVFIEKCTEAMLAKIQLIDNPIIF